MVPDRFCEAANVSARMVQTQWRRQHPETPARQGAGPRPRISPRKKAACPAACHYCLRKKAKWRNRPIVSISRRDVVDLIDGIVERGAEIQANRTFARLRALSNWAVEKDRLAASPVARMRAPTKERTQQARACSWQARKCSMVWETGCVIAASSSIASLQGMPEPSVCRRPRGNCSFFGGWLHQPQVRFCGHLQPLPGGSEWPTWK